MADTQEQLLTEIAALDPTDFIRVVNDPITSPDSAVIQKYKFVDNLFGDVITPVTTGALNDWAPTGITTAHFIRIFTSGPTTISGITSGALGRILIIFNVATSMVTLLDDSSLSAAANRIQVPGTGNDYQLTANTGVMLMYDTTASRWRIVGATTLADGWSPLGYFFTFVSADGSTTVVTVPGDVTGRVQKGDRLWYSQNQALTAYWNFDSNSLSNFGSFPTTDTAMTYTAGKFSNAATFNGTTSKIVVTDTASLKPTGEFTIGVWLKTSYTGNNQRIFQSYSANTNIAGIQCAVASGTGFVSTVVGKNTGTAINTDYVNISGSKNVADGNWHYVVITFRNNYLQIYVDGALDIGAFSYTPAYAATNYVQFGMGNNSGTDVVPFNGQLDDFFLINGYALDEGKIRSIYVANAAVGTGGFSINKYAIITDISTYNGSTTTITFWGGTDFAGVSGTFGTPYYSHAKAPFGFNINPEKWRVFVHNFNGYTINNPADNTYYYTEFGSINLTVPIGAWTLGFVGEGYLTKAASVAGIIHMALSTSTSTVTIPRLHTRTFGSLSAGGPYFGGVLTASMLISLSVKTTYYLIYMSQINLMTNLSSNGVDQPTIIYAQCAYL